MQKHISCFYLRHIHDVVDYAETYNIEGTIAFVDLDS